MSTITANRNPIVIDNTISPPETVGTTTVTYKKEPEEELWEMQPGAGWTKVNVHTRTGLGDEADYSGKYSITLSAGQIYTAGLFFPLNSPVSTDPLGTKVVVVAVFKKPTVKKLIADHSGSGGGTWLSHGIKTVKPTTLFLAGASRSPAVVKAGIPTLVDPDAVIPAPLGPAVSHDIELTPLVPGHHYFFTAMVVDAGGNWEVLDVEQDTLKRKMTVQFPKMVVFNDGDWATTGEAEFWFDVSAGSDSGPAQPLQSFNLPEPDLDDWGETGRPDALGYAYIENQPLTVPRRGDQSLGALVGARRRRALGRRHRRKCHQQGEAARSARRPGGESGERRFHDGCSREFWRPALCRGRHLCRRLPALTVLRVTVEPP